MPYIPPFYRKTFEPILEQLMNRLPREGERAGMLNYIITTLILKNLGDSPRYNDFNEMIGVLECAKQELYRRKVAPYEDTKRESQGDVY